MALAALFIAGTAVQAYGQYQQGEAFKQQGETEQEILDYNASIKDREADAALERNRAEALRFQREGEELQGKQRVALAKGGVLTSSGSPALLMEDTARNLDIDRMSILREGFLAKSSLQQEAEGIRYQGRAADRRGTNLRTASRIKTATTLLGGFKSFAAGGAFS